MLKKLEKLEIQINNKLEVAIAFISRLIHWIFPKKLFLLLEQTKQKIIDFFLKIKAAILTALMWIADKLMMVWQKIIHIKNNFSEIQSQITGKIDSTIQGSVAYIRRTSAKDIFNFLISQTKPKLQWLSLKLKQITSSQSSIAVFALVMILGGVFGIYQSTQKIYNQELKTHRAPASAQQYDYKPDYEMYPRRTATFLNIKIPISVEEVGDVNSITIDFSVRTTTRFARIYLQDYEYKLKDYFFTSVQPISSSFPLEEEGKKEIKKIITKEVNNFLKANNVEGEVEEIRILFIVGS